MNLSIQIVDPELESVPEKNEDQKGFTTVYRTKTDGSAFSIPMVPSTRS